MPVYLLHWNTPAGKAMHYLGATTREVRVRFKEHSRGYGSSYTSKLVKKLGKPSLAYVWPGAGFEKEKALKAEYRKARKGYHELCPICSGEWEQWPYDH